MPLSNRYRPTASMSLWRASGTSMIGNPDRFGVCTPRRSRQSRTAAGLPPEIRTDRVAALLVQLQARENGRQGGDGRRPGVEVRRGGRLQQSLQLGRAGEKRGQRRVCLRQPRNENDVLVCLAGVAHDAVPTVPARAQLVVASLTDDPEAVSIVHVQERVVLAGETGKRDEDRWRCPSCCSLRRRRSGAAIHRAP